MPKVLILESTVVNFGDDRGGVHQDAAELVDVSIDAARALVQAGRALYADRKDDKSKGAIHTASADMLKAADRVRKDRAAAAKAPADTGKGVSPAGGQTDPADSSIPGGAA